MQIGIASFAPANCANEAGLQSTFTNVARNLNWIRKIMNGGGEDENSQQQQGTTTTRRPSTTPSNNNKPSSTTRRPMFGFPGFG
jgi:secreted trypsin-like serine protease